MLHITSCLAAQPHRRRNVSRFLCLKLFALSVLLCPAAQAADSDLFRSLTPDTVNLNPYQWRSRPVVIFAPSEKDARYVQQMAMLKKRDVELAERDIIVLSDTSPASEGQLRAQLKVKGFEVILIGKDGDMKLRKQTPLRSEELLSIIDRMPMRKAGQD